MILLVSRHGYKSALLQTLDFCGIPILTGKEANSHVGPKDKRLEDIFTKTTSGRTLV